jgi:hypothetical protein
VRAFANVATVFHTAHELTIDFGVAQPPQAAELDDDLDYVMQARVTARVRLPVTAVYDVVAGLSNDLGRYEAEWGRIYAPHRGGNDGDEAGADDAHHDP